ncbi:MAG: hypothetical protein QNJ32_08135 [Xenococcaceae cyanobacterium MO_167.B27]|nr:hypothetical protein [Xenococcaceae cyanobacterium MO_167.B27]
MIDLSQSEQKETDNLSDNCNSIFQHPENIRDEPIWKRLKIVISEQLEILEEDINTETVIQSTYLDILSEQNNQNNHYQKNNDFLTGIVTLLSVCSSSSSGDSIYGQYIQ